MSKRREQLCLAIQEILEGTTDIPTPRTDEVDEELARAMGEWLRLGKTEADSVNDELIGFYAKRIVDQYNIAGDVKFVDVRRELQELVRTGESVENAVIIYIESKEWTVVPVFEQLVFTEDTCPGGQATARTPTGEPCKTYPTSEEEKERFRKALQYAKQNSRGYRIG